jgi:arylsulfatase A-like enzyme
MFISILAFACTGPENDNHGRVRRARDSVTESQSASDDTGQASGDAIAFNGARPRNLLVLTLDTARRDYTGFFDTRGLVPNLNAIFSGGVLLTDHHSCSNWTTPSFICAQTGRFPLDDGYWPSGLSYQGRDPRIEWPPADMVTLATILGDAGFRSELITTNAMFSLELNGGATGFQTETRAFNGVATQAVDLALASANALENSAQPWYLHVHFMDPHGPFAAPREYLPDKSLDCSSWDVSTETSLNKVVYVDYPGADQKEQELIRACLENEYGAEIRYFDDELARLWADFDERGLLEDTLVVFYTDHGEQFDEHGRFEHLWSLYVEENAAVAAFWAKNIKPLQWIEPTIHQDLTPTILAALGVPLRDHSGITLGHAPPDRVLLTFNAVYEWGEPSIAAIQNDYKLMYWWSGPKRYYDVATDPAEQTNLYDAQDPQLLALWDALIAEIQITNKTWPGLNPVDAEP